ncbi:MAG: AMP-binding protein [Rhizonema sp. NSF051]|nr:AMP-binding protein [Rhizonema sp. NSF051]
MTIRLDNFQNPLDKISTLVELLRYRAEIQPDQRAYTFLRDGETEEISLTYRELDQQARAIATRLQSLKASLECALLLYPPGLDFIAAFFGCLYAKVVAVPVYPPKHNQSLSRLWAIASDAQTAIALTVNSTLPQIQSQFAQKPEFTDMLLLATDSISIDEASNWQQVQVDRDTLAFLQYTSGSTGTPKGVMVSHGNLLQNSQYTQQIWEYNSQSVMVTWLPVFHDMGLIYGVLQPLYQGFPCYMMAPVSFIQKPIRWLQAISRYKATHSGAPNFAYELCVLKTTPEERATLDLSSWHMTLNGAEPVRADTIKQFTQAFQSCGFDLATFCPGYGLAEATLVVTGVQNKNVPIFCTVQLEALAHNQVIESKSEEKLQTLVGCGKPGIDTKVVIVHPELLTPCAPAEVGEIWVSGSTVAQGYWQRTEETKKTFGAYLKGTKEGPFMRTGDLGFLKNGELFITGRLKDVIIVRGQNHYPQDIERTVAQSHPALRPNCGAAFTVEVEGKEQLAIIQEVERTWRRKLDVEIVMRSIRKSVSLEHELQIYAIVLLDTGSIPKTSSGKIQRSACRSAFLEKSLKVVASWGDSSSQTIEQTLAGEDHELDELLRQDRSIISSGQKSHNQVEISTPIEMSKPVETDSDEFQHLYLHTGETIQNWIENWLVKKLKVDAKVVNSNQSFAEYGMDSVIAVELSQDLEDWLGQTLELEATIVWNFPTTEALAHYIASKLSISKQTSQVNSQQRFNSEIESSKNLGLKSPESNEQIVKIPMDLDTLSEEELAKLLSEEIAVNKKRK